MQCVYDSDTPRSTGKERDAETALDYFGARYFSGAQGRFTSPDPVPFQSEMVSDPQRWNLFSYARNNPTKYVDPTGEAIELTGSDEARRKALVALRLAVGDRAGTYLYEDKVTTKNKDGSSTTRYFVGIYSYGQDGDGPSFASLNAVASSLSQIVGAPQVARLEIVASGTRVNGTKIAPLDVKSLPLLGDVIFGGTPAATSSGTVSLLDPSISPGALPDYLMSNGQRGSLDWGMIVMHELGHASYNWGLSPLYHTTNDRAVALENQVRQLRDPVGAQRKVH